MAVKQMILITVYWGDWWVPIRGNSYNWAEVDGLMAKVVSGRYMDGLNQYGVGRGSIGRTHVYQIDPPAGGFGDSNVQWMFKMAIDGERIPTPDDFDLDSQQPFYSLIVKPGIEHLRDATPDGKVAQWTPDVGTGAYHFGFSYDYGDARGTWYGQACWVKADTTASGTVQRWVHEMAEAYSTAGEISDTCQGTSPVIIDGVLVPQYWSVADSSCWPPPDPPLEITHEFLREEIKAGRSPLDSKFVVKLPDIQRAIEPHP